MSEITKKRLGDIVNFKRGYDLPSYERKNGTYPIVSSSGISGYHSEYKADGEGLITGRYGTLGEMYYVNGKYWPHNTALYVTDFKGNYPKYVYFLLKSLSSFKTSDKSTVPGINRNDLHELEVPYIKPKYQKNLADCLFIIERKIELNNRINTELETMAKTLYDYWFVQFNFPDANGKPYKSSGGKMVWNDGLKREIPEGWELQQLNKYGDFKNGINYDPSIKGNTLAKIINVRNISSSNWFVSPYELDSIILRGNDVKNYLVTENDILIARSGIPGATRLMHEYENNTIYSGFIIRFQVEKFLYKNYLFFCLKDLEKSTTSQSGGTIMQNVNQDTLKRMVVIQPDEQTILNLNNFVSPIFQRIHTDIKENQQLIKLRDWLLPMLMNGQIKVAEYIKEQLSMAAEPAVPYNVQSKSFDIPERKKTFAKQVLGGKIVSLFMDDPHFTHIKFQKLQYLAEHIAEADLHPNYYFQAAGPYDNVFMHTIAYKFRQSKWFDEQEYKYIPLEKQSQIEEYYTNYFAPVSERLSQLFSLLANVTEAEVEIIATLYAVWNNRIILKQLITEESLIEDFYNWSDRKHKYLKEQVLEGLLWLTTNKMEPSGFGNVIKRSKGEKKI